MVDKNTIQEKTEKLVKMTAAFCASQLDDEYRELTERLIRKMSRKREVPFKRGKLEIWAAASVYAIGQLNFLFDKSFEPYATADDIAGHFGANKSTVSQKAQKIREMFNMESYDSEFSTRRMLENNPFDKLLEIEDLIVHSARVGEMLNRAAEFSEITVMPFEQTIPLPETSEAWIDDIAEAMKVAIRVLNLAMQDWDESLTQMDAVYIAPHVFFSRRGQNLTLPMRDELAKMMLRNYAATVEYGEGGAWLEDSPFLSFAFCWLLCHFQADFIDEVSVEKLMDICIEYEAEAEEDDTQQGIAIELIDSDEMEMDSRDWDAHETRVRSILGDEEEWEEDECRKLYTDYLRQHLKLPCEVTGIEDFRWEEFYVCGPGNKREYSELKKERPSYTDKYELRAIDPEWSSEWVMHHGVDIGVDVRRISDGKEFTLGLSELKATDKSSPNYQLLDDYAVWFVNGML